MCTGMATCGARWCWAHAAAAASHDRQRGVVCLAAQRALDERLDTLLADAPRRSVLMIDSGKSAEDGGCASVPHASFVAVQPRGPEGITTWQTR
jgi:hypothetical protein